jgi:glycosyltransferase involved in cell wall biosynthesis
LIPVLFVCPNLNVGGAERHWAVLIPALAEHGIRPSVLTLDGTGPFFDDLQARGIPVDCARLRSRYDVARLAAAIRRSVADQPRIILSRAASALVVGQIIARQSGASHIYNEHRQVGRPLGARVRRMMSLVAPRTTGVVAISKLQRPALAGLGFRDIGIWTVANGVPVRDRDPKTVAAMRAQLGIESSFCAVLVAALRPEKDVETFVRAIALAATEGVTGIVVGDGPQRAQLEATAAQQGAPVRFLGSRTDAVEVMAAADVVCLSSRFEGVPMALLEAMSVSRPVVATRVGAISEIVSHEQTGLLVDPGDDDAFADALRRLSRDPSLCRALGTEAQRHQRQNNSSSSMISGYAEVLHALA